MRGSLAAALFFSVLLVPAISQSLSGPPEDLEGSGYDLNGSGSGSGDGSDQDEITNVKVQPNSFEGRIFTANAGGGNRNTDHGSSGLTSEGAYWPARDDESGFVIMGSSKPFWENKDILAAVIAGGVTGVVIAVALSALLIHIWLKKDEEGHFLGRRRASDEDYHKPIRNAVIV